MTHKEFREFLAGKEITYLDGGCGSNLLKRGLPQGVCPEYWMCENIDVDAQEVISAANLFNQNEYIPIVAEINYSLTTNNNSMKYPRQSKKNLYIWLMVLFIIISFFVIILYSLLRK